MVNGLPEEEPEQEDTAPHPSHCSFVLSSFPGEHLMLHTQECGPVKLSMS